jgi:hypothetical protein
MGLELGALALYASIASAAVSTGVGVMNAQEQKKAAAETERQAATKARLAELQNQQTARAALRKQRMVAATMAQAAANTGTAGSSGFAGGLAGVEGQTSANLGYLGTTMAGERDMFTKSQEIAKGQATMGRNTGIGQVAGAVGNVANQVFEAEGGYAGLFSD